MGQARRRERSLLPVLIVLLLGGQRGWGAACPPETYRGANEKCFPCLTCEGELVYEKECSETANAVCKCIRCEVCGIGEEWTQQGCQSCPKGTFNNQVDGECRNWTQCPSNKILTPGTEEKDVICMPESKDPAPLPTAPSSGTTEGIAITASIALTVSLAVCVGLLMFFCIIFSLWVQKKLPGVFMKLSHKPPAQEVEDCNCHYPEEEEGGDDDSSGMKGELLENIP